MTFVPEAPELPDQLIDQYLAEMDYQFQDEHGRIIAELCRVESDVVDLTVRKHSPHTGRYYKCHSGVLLGQHKHKDEMFAKRPDCDRNDCAPCRAKNVQKVLADWNVQGLSPLVLFWQECDDDVAEWLARKSTRGGDWYWRCKLVNGRNALVTTLQTGEPIRADVDVTVMIDRWLYLQRPKTRVSGTEPNRNRDNKTVVGSRDIHTGRYLSMVDNMLASQADAEKPECDWVTGFAKNTKHSRVKTIMDFSGWQEKDDSAGSFIMFEPKSDVFEDVHTILAALQAG